VLAGRKRIAPVLATLCITAVGGSVLAASPSYAEPDVDHVQTKVDRLYQQAEQASERANDARLRLKKVQHHRSSLRADLRRQQAKVERVRSQVGASVLTHYQGQTSAGSQLLLANDAPAVLSQLAAVSAYDAQRTALLADLAVQKQRLQARQAEAERQLVTARKATRKLGTKQATVDHKAADAKALLDKLKERAAVASRSGTRVGTSVPASGRAAAAVKYALAQVGKAYVYGAAGPSAFDCSGLTMAAWSQAGVGLPHSSGAQMGSGRPVSQSELQPGDLVFYYSPVSHVGMYIGNGQIVNALNPGAGVRISGVNSMPYSGAVRPG
jgi:cell wall-associated NlpC family hydrolase